MVAKEIAVMYEISSGRAILLKIRNPGKTHVQIQAFCYMHAIVLDVRVKTGKFFL